MTVPDQLSLEDARHRYSIGKTALQDRLNHCGIRAQRSGTRSFLSASQIEILDQLEGHLRSGRGMAEFHSPFGVVIEEDVRDQGGAIVPTASDPIVHQAPAVHQLVQLETLERVLRFLDSAAERGWLLPTADIGNLLGAEPRGKEWSRYGFVFTPAGRHGQSTAWKVTKTS